MESQPVESSKLPVQEGQQLDEISFSSNSNSDGSKANRRKKVYERKRSSRGLSNSKSPKSEKSVKRSRSRSNRSEQYKGTQENESRKASEDANPAGMDDRERKRQRRAARQEEGRGTSPQGQDYYKSSYRGDRDRYGRDGDRHDRRRQRIQFPSFRDRLYTRKDFDNYQSSRHFDKQELTEAYNEYVSQYKEKQEMEFYREHKSEPWFVERYDPSSIFFWRQIQSELSQYNAEKFKQTLESMKNDGDKSEYCQLKLETNPAFDYNQLQDAQGQDIILQKAPLFSFDTDSMTLYLKYIPVHIKRQELTDLLKENLNGFVHLSMSEPMRNHGFERLAWVNFESDHDTTQALQKIDTFTIDLFKLSAARSHPNKKKTPVRIAPPLPEKQIEYDYEICKQLITKVFDPEKEIDSYVITEIEKVQPPLSSELKLDLLLLYLRRVHSYCLYCGEEYEDERMLSTRCGPQHIRNCQKIPQEEFQEIMTKNIEPEDNPEEEEKQPDISKDVAKLARLNTEISQHWGGSITYLQKYMSLAKKKVDAGPRKWIDPYEQFVQNDKIEWCQSHCEEQDFKDNQQCFTCTICKQNGKNKRFMTEEFAIQHIQKMHCEIIEETYKREQTISWLSKTYRERNGNKKKMKANYFDDENKLFNQPGRKYSQAESSYYTGGGRGGDWEGGSPRNRDNRDRGDRGRGFRGSYRGRGFNRGNNTGDRSYVDLDDPERLQNQTQAEERGQIDYGDLFG